MNSASRSFFSQLAAGSATQLPKQIRINGNENPVGPGPTALAAILEELGEANRYPFNSTPGNIDLVEVLAARFSVGKDNLVIGAGSSEILRSAVRIYAGNDRHIVTANLTYGTAATEARKHNFPYREVPLDSDLRLDLESMKAEARDSGFVYVCNPNNPTGTIHPASVIEEFIEDTRRIAPEALILIDEAYHDYVTDPAHYTMIPRALRTPNIVVARTFSKAYGMAGLRLGFGVGHADTMAALRRHQLPGNANIMAIAAAVASLRDPDHLEQERQRNADVRAFTESFFKRNGFALTESQCNFLFVDLQRPAKEFREACGKKGIVVGRDFPPFEKTHCRISLGTMQEMEASCAVFAEVLGVDNDEDKTGAAS